MNGKAYVDPDQGRPGACISPSLRRTARCRAMRFRYAAEMLTAKRVDQAYPVARLADPALQLEDWRQTCRAVLDEASDPPAFKRQGCLISLDAQGYIRGLGLYRSAAAHNEEVTLVTTFIVASLLDRPEIAATLLRRLEEAAGRGYGAKLKVCVPEGETWTRRYLALSGYGC